MPKAVVVEDPQLAHAVKVARVSSAENGTRDAALLLCLFGTGLKPGEVAGLQVADYLNADGSVKVDSTLRADIAFNSRERPLHWVNTRLIAAIDEHLAERVRLGHGMTNRPAAYRGLDPQSGLFVSGRTGESLKLTRIESDGVVTYRAEQVSALISKLFKQAGIEGASAQSGRRTMAVKLKRSGIDERHIGDILGMTSLKAIRALCETEPVRLGDLIKILI
ncbi:MULTISPECIES: site-specific integrase [Shewanella]|uniref:site-specific integrase n=1 Tax=Shewanella TaxID=22 RepID=UPI000F421E84|nr:MULTISPECIES: site-specific integrase [Shewanella]AYV11545.1 site-specific integrase [Shewanella algae]